MSPHRLEDPSTITPDEFRDARIDLGLDRGQFGFVLGYEGFHANDQVYQMEKGRKPIRPAQARLVHAYLAGYRPPDWGSNGLDEALEEAAMQPAILERD